MSQEKRTTNQNQEVEIIVEVQAPNSRSSEKIPEAASDECAEEASEKVVTSTLLPKGEADERSFTNLEVAHSRAHEPTRPRISNRKSRVIATYSPNGQSSVPDQVEAQQVRKSSSRKTTGPRTFQGKERSKYNALKHGGFTKSLLMKNESLHDNQALWDGLWEDLQPQGTLAKEIFMDIFMTFLNRRRYRKARNAMIAEKIQFFDVERSLALQSRAWYLEHWGRAEDGMLKPEENHFVLRKCTEILKQVRQDVEQYGFDIERDRHFLQKLYGTDIDGVAPLGVFDFYLQAARSVREPGDGEQKVDPNQRKQLMLQWLDIEIANVTALEKADLSRERMRQRYKLDQSLALSPEALDRDIRYDTHFTRDLARKLSLFDHAQRMHKGLQALHPVNVDD